ncbi:MAG: hypothetical protein V7L01_14465 [Nostoc sp.]|uniref:hypothetical protein n=1 Tax=Nostoc sp. TaxID=1180 RepID=UPI002FFC3492
MTGVGAATHGNAVLKNNHTPGNSADDFIVFASDTELTFLMAMRSLPKIFATDEYAVRAYTMYALTNVSIGIWLNGMNFHGM